MLIIQDKPNFSSILLDLRPASSIHALWYQATKPEANMQRHVPLRRPWLAAGGLITQLGTPHPLAVLSKREFMLSHLLNGAPRLYDMLTSGVHLTQAPAVPLDINASLCDS